MGARRPILRAALIAGFCGAIPFSLGALRPASGVVRDCTATLTPDTISAGSDSVSIAFMFDDSIGTVTEVTPAEGSGLTVVSVDAAGSTLLLDASAATAGDWQLSFMGSDEDEACPGTLHVVGPAKR